jgi:hypothetical protein
MQIEIIVVDHIPRLDIELEQNKGQAGNQRHPDAADLRHLNQACATLLRQELKPHTPIGISVAQLSR